MRKYTLAIVVLLVVMLALTSCELLFRRNKHIHEYSNAWSYDSNRHYHLCECGDVFDMADHIDGIIDGRCDVCGYKIANVYTVTLIVDEEIDTGAHAFSVREGETLSFLVTVPMGYTIGVEGADTVGDPVASSTGAGNIYTLRVSEVESDVTVYITTVSVTPRCNHEIIAYPTCTESGECLICGDNIGEPLGHAYADATCTSRSACTRCGDEIGDYEPHEYIAPTCDTPYTCSVCGATNGEALGHNFSTPTCTLPSSCDREGCGEIGDAPLGHTGGVPTCENGGICLRCTSEYIPPLGHDMSEPTCTSASHCLRDGCDHTEGAKLPHTYDYTVTDPTCTSNGYTTYTCLDCGLKYIDHIIAALGHSWQAATCTTAKICAVCNTTDGTPLGHSWKAATCTTAKTCTVCNTTDGTPLGHSWQAATCTTAKTCTVCNTTDGAPLGHSWKAATCTTAKTCTVCNATEGTALGHSWQAATCTTAKTCTVCNTTDGTPLGHGWKAATCTTAKTCTVCNATEGTALGHSWKAATCTTAKTCTVCNATEGTALGHSWQAATCTTAKTCTACNTTDGTPLGHSWKAATCTTAKTCTACNTTDGTPLGHSWKAATCTTAKICTVCNTTVGEPLTHVFIYTSLGDGTHEVSCSRYSCKLAYIEACNGEPTLTEAAFCSICNSHYGEPLPPPLPEKSTVTVIIGEDNYAYVNITVDTDGVYYFSIGYDIESYPESMPYVAIDIGGNGDYLALDESIHLSRGVSYSVMVIFYSGESVDIIYSQDADDSSDDESYSDSRELLIGQDYTDSTTFTVSVSGLYKFDIVYPSEYVESPPYVTVIEDGGYIEYDVTENVWLEAGVTYVLSAIFYPGESITVTYTVM